MSSFVVRLMARLCVAVLMLATTAAHAQAAFPSKPITLIVPFGAGGSTDLSSRALGNALAKLLGQPVLVENRPGGSGAVAIANMKQRPADGHTLLVLGSTQIANQFMSPVAYDVARDFTTVAVHMSYNAGLVVRNDAPWKTLAEFLAHAKAHPGKVSYSIAAAGSPQHLAMVRVGQQAGAEMIFVPFGDGVKAVTAVLGEQVTAASQVTEWKPHVEAGTLRLLVTYGDKRMPQFPAVPTLKESGFDITGGGFNSIVAMKGTPPDQLAALARALRTALAEPDSELSQILRKYDLVEERVVGADAEAFVARFTDDTRRIIQSLPAEKK